MKAQGNIGIWARARVVSPSNTTEILPLRTREPLRSSTRMTRCFHWGNNIRHHDKLTAEALSVVTETGNRPTYIAVTTRPTLSTEQCTLKCSSSDTTKQNRYMALSEIPSSSANSTESTCSTAKSQSDTDTQIDSPGEESERYRTKYHLIRSAWLGKPDDWQDDRQGSAGTMGT
jgi:hypothetical protein